MGRIISISGCRSIGKTTLINGLKRVFPEMITREGFRRTSLGLNMDLEQDYYLNEKWYIKREIEEYDKVKRQNKDALFLRGPEDLEFYALHYPVTMGKNWDVENNLMSELKELRKRRSDYILYLSASDQTIWNRCQNDTQKKRDNLQEWMQEWEQYFDRFMRSRENVFVLNTDNRFADEVLNMTLDWMRRL